MTRPAADIHVLMSIDAVGGVWRYAMDLAAGMAPLGYRFTFAGFGPPPSARQADEASRLGHLVWLDAQLDWTTEDEAALDAIPALLSDLARGHRVDALHLNLPSQAAGLSIDLPVVVVSHSCVVTWFAAVRQTEVPPGWTWQTRRNRAGFDGADAVIAPTRAHADALVRSYGHIDGLTVVHNGTATSPGPAAKEPFVFAAGRWWDDGKNAAVLDAAAAMTRWPVLMAGAQTGPSGQHRAVVNARTTGELRHADIIDLMSRASIVASPSIYEPFGLAPLEAAACGAALVLSDIPTYRELWGGAALFANARNPSDFATAIDRLAADASLRTQLGAAALDRAGRFTLPAQARAMSAVYERLLAPSAVAV